MRARVFRLFGLSVTLWLVMVSGPSLLAQQNAVTVCSSGCNYASIQTALSALSGISTIQVKTGIYLENVTITGSLLPSVTTVNLVGDGPGQTILQGSMAIEAMKLLTVTGFTIAGKGLLVQSSSAVTLFNNQITGVDGNGLSIVGSGPVAVQSNGIKANQGSGVTITLDSKAVLSANNIASNSADGITLMNAQALATDNVIQNNSGCGVRTDSSAQLVGGENTAGGNGGGDACGNVPSGFFVASPTPALAKCTVTLGPDDIIQQAINAAEFGAVICLSAGKFAQSFTVANKARLNLRGAGRDRTLLTGSSDTGVAIEGAAQVAIQGITVSGFTCAMISARGSAQVTIQESRLTNNSQACPLLEVADSAQVTVQDSQISGSLEDAIDINSSLVRVYLFKNTISDNRDDAIYLTMLERYQDPATIAACQGNTFTNNGGGISNNDDIVKKCTVSS